MIVFLILSYTALLVALMKFKVIKPTLGWKVSPLFFAIFCFVGIAFPMQWGAPSGSVNVYRYVVEIVPNVSGEVVSVSAKPLEPMKKGDVLFNIDPRPYQSEVNRLEAVLKHAEQAAKMLPADLESAQAAVVQAESTITQTQRQAESLEAAFNAAQAAVEKSEAQVSLTQDSIKRTKILYEKEAVTKSELDVAERNLESAIASLDGVKAKREQAELAFHSRIGGVNTIVIHAQQALRAAKAAETKAQLALESTIDGENTEVAQLKSQLELAKLNLDWTTVHAPEDGYVIQLALRPGQRVMNSPVRSWLAYVEQDKTRVVVWIKQYQLRHVKPGQEVEVDFKLYPAQTFHAKVEAVLGMNAMGQLQATGKIQDPGAVPRIQQEYGVILTLDENSPIDISELPGGAVGSAAIFTDHTKMTHFVRRVEMRMKSWMNYIIP